MRKHKILREYRDWGGQVFKKFDQLYSKDVAAIKEGELKEEYRRSGWIILNIAKTGGLGGATLLWTLDACKKDALKYKSRTEWVQRSPGAYSSARTKGWIDECCVHMRVRKLENGTWTLENCKKDALKYETKGDWKKHSGAAYGIAWANEWLVECCAHMRIIRNRKGYWTLDLCKVQARKYRTKNEWETKHAASCDAARRNGWFQECSAHMIGNKHWTLDLCKAEGRKHRSKTEWMTMNGASYQTAYKKGWLEECCDHMITAKEWKSFDSVDEKRHGTSYRCTR